MITEEKIVEILKQFEQQDYKRGGVSIDPSNYNAIARTVVKNCSIPDVSISLERAKKYAEHQHYKGTINEPLVEFEEWEAKD